MAKPDIASSTAIKKAKYHQDLEFTEDITNLILTSEVRDACCKHFGGNLVITVGLQVDGESLLEPHLLLDICLTSINIRIWINKSTSTQKHGIWSFIHAYISM